MSLHCSLEAERYWEKRRRTSIPRRCCETGRTIQPGEFYWRCTLKAEGEFYTSFQCDAAYHFARWCNGVGPGNLHVPGSLADGEGLDCVPFGSIHELVDLVGFEHPEVEAEWACVKRGEVTRDTTTPAPAPVEN